VASQRLSPLLAAPITPSGAAQNGPRDPRSNPQDEPANPLWGAPRIHGELLKLGIDVSQATVGRYLPWRPKVPSPTWRSFLHNHLHGSAAVDLFVVVTARFQLLYTLVVLGHERRKVIHFDVTRNPIQGWLARQITEACPWDTAPRFLLRDRDASYGQTFRDRVRAMAIEEVIDRHGRMRMWSASSARSAANVSITSSSSMSVTCAVCCRHILTITTEAARISRWTRIVRNPGPHSHPPQAPLSPSHRLAVCTIATNVTQRELLPVLDLRSHSTLRVVASGNRGCHGPRT
jgi:hypothetical protein